MKAGLLEYYEAFEQLWQAQVYSLMFVWCFAMYFSLQDMVSHIAVWIKMKGRVEVVVLSLLTHMSRISNLY